MLFKLAWRSIWRNKVRTFITMGAIFMAVILSTLMMSFKDGVYTNMIDAMVGAFTGYGQIHKAGYWDDKNLDNSMELNDSLIQSLTNEKQLLGYAERLESFALAASKDKTKGALVIGINPEKEAQYSLLHQRVKEGAYLNAGDEQVLIGNGLAMKLGLAVGDTLVLIGQGYHGASAAGKYRVKGIVKFGSPELSTQLVFLPLKAAQYLYNAEGMFTSIVLHFHNSEKASSVITTLKTQINKQYEVMDWIELTPELNNMIEFDKLEGYVFMFILYLVISFGIFGTMLMMMAERTHEFGVMVAIGMNRTGLAVMVWLEIMFISILGSLLGMLGAFPVCAYFHFNPIHFGKDMAKMYEEYGMEAVLQSSLNPSIFLQQGIIIAIIASIIALYPFFKILKLNAIQSMRN
jgi:putative ABC transport system permease protein